MTRSAFAVLASIYRNRFNVMLNLEKSIAALAIALPGVMQAQTSEFSALCVRQAWENGSAETGVVDIPTHNSTFFGLPAEYNFDVANHLTPYARLGFTGTWPNARPHGGSGLEYKFTGNVGVGGEWTSAESSHDVSRRHNNSPTRFTVCKT
jgi:outer membrane immunogenic protein